MTSNLLKLRTDYWSADESDDVKMQRKKKNDLLIYKMIKWSFDHATLVTEILFIAVANTDLLMALLKFLMMHK